MNSIIFINSTEIRFSFSGIHSFAIFILYKRETKFMKYECTINFTGDALCKFKRKTLIIIENYTIMFNFFDHLSQAFGEPLMYRREMRFTKVSAQFFNKSVGEVTKFNINQHHGQQHLNLHVNMYIPKSPESVRNIWIKNVLCCA